MFNLKKRNKKTDNLFKLIYIKKFLFYKNNNKYVLICI